MERHIFDPNQPQGSMSLMNLRNTLRGLFQGDFMALRPRASFILEDMEYPTDSLAQAKWSGTGVTVSASSIKQEGNFALQAVIDATADRKLSRLENLNLIAFKRIKLWQRCSASSSLIKFYLRDNLGNESYWDITTNVTPDTWQQDDLDLTAPTGNNGSNADLANIVEFGFQGLDALTAYIFDTIKANCGLNVAVEGATLANFYQQVYAGNTKISFSGGSSSIVTPPAANPRIDLLTIDSTGSLEWTQGQEASSPVEPAIPNNKIPICLIYCKTTMQKIVDFEEKDAFPNEAYIYKDVRPLFLLGVMSFLALTDTPSSYSGQANKYLKVNAQETAIEFATLVLTFLALTDTPDSYSGQAGKSARVNSGEAGLEFAFPNATYAA